MPFPKKKTDTASLKNENQKQNDIKMEPSMQ